MRIFLNIISICIILIAAFFAKLNLHTIANISLYGIRSHNLFTHETTVFYIAATLFILGFLAGGLFLLGTTLPLKKKLKEYQRKLEKNSVQTDEDASRVSVLEAKIETLERALESALKKND